MNLTVIAGCGSLFNKPAAVDPGPIIPRVALVNGREITQPELLQVLLPSYGPRALEEMILLEIITQHAQSKGIALTGRLADEEMSRILNEIAAGKPLHEQEALFKYMLKTRNVTAEVFDLIVKERALLRKCVNQEVEISEQALADEFERTHGEKLIVRQLAVSSIRDISTAQNRLENGDSFIDIVLEMSQDQPSLLRGGLLDPFSRTDEHIPSKVRQEAFKLTEIKQISAPFSTVDSERRGWRRILQLENVIPAENITIDSVRDKLTAVITKRTIYQRMLDLKKELKAKASVKILNKNLIPKP